VKFEVRSGKEKQMSYQMIIDIPKCTGCGICELACSLYHEKECNPEKARGRVIRYEEEGIVYSLPIVCQQCEKAPCQEVCPTKAITRDPKTNALNVDGSRCIGCRMCSNACPFGCISVDKKLKRAVKCDYCGGAPKCAELCPTGALSFLPLDKAGISKRRRATERYLENLKVVLRPLVE